MPVPLDSAAFEPWPVRIAGHGPGAATRGWRDDRGQGQARDERARRGEPGNAVEGDSHGGAYAAKLPTLAAGTLRHVHALLIPGVTDPALAAI